MTVLSRREGTSVAYSCACRSLGRFCRDLFDRAQSLTSGGCEGWRYAPVAARSLSRLRAGLLRLASARQGLSFQGRLLPFFPVIAASRACSYRGEIFTSGAALPRRYVSRWGETGGLYVFEHHRAATVTRHAQRRPSPKS